MVYKEIIHGKFVDLRSVTLDDAEFSYNIRKDEKHCDVVGQLAESIEKQREYIEWQMKQPDDYYFVVLNKKGERIGLIGIYDIKGDMGEIGREVNYGGPMETIEAKCLIQEFSERVLGLKRMCYVIYLNNKRNISYQKKNGLSPKSIVMRGNKECAYYEVNIGKGIDSKLKEMMDIIGVEQSE